MAHLMQQHRNVLIESLFAIPFTILVDFKVACGVVLHLELTVMPRIRVLRASPPHTATTIIIKRDMKSCPT